jgi:predicted component of type VI protein secretion system
MGLRKGQTNNPAGKPPGTKNKINAELRLMINDFLNSEFETIKDDFQKLEPKERMKFYTDLLQYGLPKLQATNLEIDFESLSDEQLTEIIDKLIERSNE